MKTVKTKLHHHRKTKATLHTNEAVRPDVDASLSDLDDILFSMERTPKQENL